MPWAARARLSAALLTCLALACLREEEPAETPKRGRVRTATRVADVHSSTTGWTIRDLRLEDRTLDGASGLAKDDSGVFWAVTERSSVLTAIDLEHARVIRSVPIRGILGGVDAESLAHLGGARFAVGTERRQADRAQDEVLIVEVGKEEARITDRLLLPWASWGLSAGGNQGIEGACAAGGEILVAGEPTLVESERRYAPLASRKISGGEWAIHRIPLTSRTGKISALACRARDGAIEVAAIERHYEVSRLLRFVLPTSPGTAISAELAVDLAQYIDPMPNLEGLEWLDGDSFVLLSDNQGAIAVGPTKLFILGRR